MVLSKKWSDLSGGSAAVQAPQRGGTLMLSANIDRTPEGVLTFAGYDVTKLAKQYGTNDSPSFVNGILAKFAE